MNDAALDLPEEFSDGTMHIFSTGKDAASRFTFVVSRADMEAGDTVETFVQRLVAHMRKTLPRFELKNVLVRDIGGETAREIDYLWLSEGAPLHQRQTVVVLHAASGVPPRAISFIGTCQKAFSPERAKLYAQMVASVKLKMPTGRPFKSRRLDATADGLIFVLRESDGSLRIVPGLTELFRHDVAEVLTPDVAFFDHTGAPLTLKSEDGSAQGWRHRDGTIYVFWTVDPTLAAPLIFRLDTTRSVVGAGNLKDPDAVRTYLRSVAASDLMMPAQI
ncbi:DcrB-related protein [Paraburkholderia phenazinium]|uniref:DcrB-related protein n=1 Tax=Paraburkholderia phenazinium TaxID=60549 RepID=UPI00158E07D2|nr:DcrB-related protein [Paraburkholderia phenazinium]